MRRSALLPATLGSAAALAVLVQSSFASVIPPSPPHKRASVCNGDASLCSRLYSNFTFIGAHNSYAISETSIAANQDLSIAQQLDAGIRLLQAQALPGNSSSGVQLCHTSCDLFNGGSLENWLGQIKSWSDANPNDVLTLLIVNNDAIPPSSFANAYASTGLEAKAWKPASDSNGGSISRSQWPTLGSMIDAGTPIVSFLAQGADTSSVPYLLPEFGSMWETAYGQTDTTDGFSCAINRIANGANAADLMYLSNQFKDVAISTDITYPDKNAINTTNSEASITQSADICAQQNGGMAPNFILLDFVNDPPQQPFMAVAAMNNVAYVAPAASSSSSDGDSSSSGNAGSGTNGSSSNGASSSSTSSGGSSSASTSAASTLLGCSSSLLGVVTAPALALSALFLA